MGTFCPQEAFLSQHWDTGEAKDEAPLEVIFRGYTFKKDLKWPPWDSWHYLCDELPQIHLTYRIDKSFGPYWFFNDEKEAAGKTIDIALHNYLYILDSKLEHLNKHKATFEPLRNGLS